MTNFETWSKITDLQQAARRVERVGDERRSGEATDPSVPAVRGRRVRRRGARPLLGVLVDGYEHRESRVAESVIALVLLAGLALSLIRPAWTREAGLAAQGFALLGTLVGVFTIIVGVGPRTAPDIVYHLGIVAVLVWGLVVAARAPANARQHT